MEQCLITATVQNIKRIIRVFEEQTPVITRNCIQWASDSLAHMVGAVRRTIQKERESAVEGFYRESVTVLKYDC